MASKKQKLIAKVDSIDNLNAFLTKLPSDMMRSIIKEALNKCEPDIINQIYHNMLPIDEILPDAIIQKILSYDQHSVYIKSVSKSFKKLSDKNDAMQLKQIRKIVEEESNRFNIQDAHFSDTRYFVVDQTRTQLNENEVKLGYKGPIDTINNALSQSEDGDTLLIYHATCLNEKIYINKKTAFIGMGSNVILKQIKEIAISNDVYFKNIRFDCSDMYDDDYGDESDIWSLVLYSNGNIWMENCKMTLHPHCGAIVMHYRQTNHSLYLRECELRGGHGGVSISFDANNADIIGCKFADFCTSVHLQTIREQTRKTKIKIVGNEVINDERGKWIVFDNIHWEDTDTMDKCNAFINGGSYIIENNLIKGRSSIFKNSNNRLERRDANKIYHLKT